MKHLLLSILIFGFGISGSFGQTIKSLGYNTTNGQVVYSGTNTLTLPQNINAEVIYSVNSNAAIGLDEDVLRLVASSYIDVQGILQFNNTTNAATTRTNLGLGSTNTPAFAGVNFGTWSISESGGDIVYNASGLGGSALKLTYSTLELGNSLAGSTAIAFSPANTTGAAVSRTNLGLGATWLTNTDVANFRDGIGLGRSNDVIFKSLTLETITGGVDYVVMNQVAGSSWIKFSDDDVTRSPFSFSSDALQARARTNLGVAPAPIFKVITNNFSITNQTNMTEVGGLTFATEANKKYIIELFPILSASASSTVMQIVPSNAIVYGLWDNLGASSYSTNALTNPQTLNVTSERAILQKAYVVAGTNAGSIVIQFRSNVETNTNTIGVGSYMMAQEVTPTP